MAPILRGGRPAQVNQYPMQSVGLPDASSTSTVIGFMLSGGLLLMLLNDVLELLP